MAEPKITLDEVDRVARLARLELSGAERERMRSQLDSILSYIDKLRQLDTEGVEPTSHAIPRAGGRETGREIRAGRETGWEMMTNVMRGDEVRPSFTVADMLANAPEREGDFFRVPRIIEG